MRQPLHGFYVALFLVSKGVSAFHSLARKEMRTPARLAQGEMIL
jgi:hypothetical protein